MRVLISGGGTGGHVFPAIAIADAIRIIKPEAEILFVGANGRMEMQKVPSAGYKIIGLPIRGFQRKKIWKNFNLLFIIGKSLMQSLQIIRSFKPDVVVGVGGYASGPVLRVASWLNKPILIQEQNSLPGITNKMLAAAASKICVAFEGLEKYFNKNKIVITGNPVREELKRKIDKREACEYFGLNPELPTVGIFGGSLGAKSINEAIINHSSEIRNSSFQFLWQTGKLYYDNISKQTLSNNANVKMFAFIDRMDYAYAACDVVISRSGALTLAELCVTQKPAILIPSPNVAEDHQRKNAEAMTKHGAAKMVLDADMQTKLWNQLAVLINNEEELNQIKLALTLLAKPNAAKDIANQVISLATNQNQNYV